MPVKYCPAKGCGEKISYSATAPAKCPACGCVFATAFKQIANNQSVIGGSTWNAVEPLKKLTDDDLKISEEVDGPEYAEFLRFKNRAKASTREDVIKDMGANGEGIESDEFDSYTVQANAKLLAEGLSAEDFEIGVNRPNVFKFTDLAQAAPIAPTSPAKKPRKKK